MTASSLFASDDDRQANDASLVAENQRLNSADQPGAASTSLYRKYRPNSFDAEELVGQEHVVRTLRNAISLGRIAHAYLFSGPRGTGKTTTARLLAKAINCLAADPHDRPCNQCAHCIAINRGASPDIIEIDAASNRGIDDIRDLREKTRYAPVQLASKVYIIDEAHQITGAAANAFLKTLEEPPAHSRFILATTDPEELLPTIVSRCQRFEFRRVALEDMVKRLKIVAALENISISDAALRLIARNATGSLRDALGLLEQLAIRTSSSSSTNSAEGAADVSVDDVRQALGLSRTGRVEALAEALAARDAAGALQLVQDAVADGEDPRQLNRQLASYLRLLLLERAGGHADGDERARAIAGRFSLLELATLAQRFSGIDFSIKHSPFPQLPLEVALVEATARGAREGENAPVAPETPDREQQPPSPAGASLRERVRNPDAQRNQAPGSSTAATRPEPAPITPIRPLPAAEPPRSATQAAPGFDIEQIAELWPSVRADVKALNRRIEALLSEVDPVAIAGNLITLAVPYPFHRDKLNSDDVRDTVAGVLSRRLDTTVSITCILRGEMPTVAAAPTARTTPTAEEPAATDEAALDAARLRAAKNIFDAEEVDPADLGITWEESAGT